MTPPLVGWAFKELLLFCGGSAGKSNARWEGSQVTRSRCPALLRSVDGDRGRDELAAISYRGCGYRHRIAGRNRGRGLVSGWNIARDGTWIERATLPGGKAGETRAPIGIVVGDDRCDSCRGAGIERGGWRKRSAKRNHDRGSLVPGPAGDKYGARSRGNDDFCNQWANQLAKGHQVV